MLLIFLFFISKLSILNTNDTSFVKVRIKNESDETIERAKIIYRYGKNELITFTDNKGESEFILNTGINLLKIYKEGFYSKGCIENFTKGRNDITIRILPKVGKIKGTISNSNSILENITILLVNEKDEIIKTVKSSNQGIFNFNNIPLFRKYYLKVIKEKFLPYRSDSILLKGEKKYIRNINLRTGEVTLIVEVFDRNNRPLSQIFVEVDGKEHETDINGITTFKVLPNQNSILVKVREYKIEEKVKIIKEKDYLTKKILIDVNFLN